MRGGLSEAQWGQSPLTFEPSVHTGLNKQISRGYDRPSSLAGLAILQPPESPGPAHQREMLKWEDKDGPIHPAERYRRPSAPGLFHKTNAVFR